MIAPEVNPSEVWQGVQSYLVMDLVALPLALGCLWLLNRYALSAMLGEPALPAPRAILRALAQFGNGLLAALFLLLVAVLPPWALGLFSPAAPGWTAFDAGLRAIDWPVRGGTKLLFILQSLFEEALFRGIGLSLLALLLIWLCRIALAGRRLGPVAWFYCGLMANLVIALAFASVHIKNPEVSALGIANIALAGYFLGAVFVYQRSIWGAWSAHFLWNFAIAVLGLPVSGIALSAPQYGLGFSGAAPGILSGGAFGPEGSLPCSIGLLLLSFWYTARSWSYAHAQQAKLEQLVIEPAAGAAGISPAEAPGEERAEKRAAADADPADTQSQG